jgi:hypothetical protein
MHMRTSAVNTCASSLLNHISSAEYKISYFYPCSAFLTFIDIHVTYQGLLHNDILVAMTPHLIVSSHVCEPSKLLNYTWKIRYRIPIPHQRHGARRLAAYNHKMSHAHPIYKLTSVRLFKHAPPPPQDPKPQPQAQAPLHYLHIHLHSISLHSHASFRPLHYTR